MLGILVAIWVGNKRWLARGGKPEVVIDVAIWAVPFGIVGARAYHVATDWDRYFGDGRNPGDALRIWEGGLSIWGAIAFGVLGGWIGARRRGIPLPALADALAPGIVLAQAIGRWGNYFNQELFGGPTDLPWALEIDAAHRPAEFFEEPTFHPTFLYESLWALVVFGILLWADKRFTMGHGRVFALYVALYTAGRTAIESLRIDTGGDVEGPAREILGMRINGWVAALLFVGAIAYIVVSARLQPGREDPKTLEGHAAPEDGTDDGEDSEVEDVADGDTEVDGDGDIGGDAEPEGDAESDSEDDDAGDREPAETTAAADLDEAAEAALDSADSAFEADDALDADDTDADAETVKSKDR
jgi:prolipoprotein diacylglyceryl transferase